MRTTFVPNYLQTTELAADAMISEGGAIQQPRMQDAAAMCARLDKLRCHPSAFWREWTTNPMAMFWTGLATGLAISLLKKPNPTVPHP